MAHSLIPLTQLHPGQSAKIVKYSADISPSYRKLLQHLGITPRVTITLIRRAPLGDPLQLQLLGSQFSLRATEACHIYVEYSN
ncbi:FeoA family protein [Rickettsiella grylli]|uniref:FeoA family protein n=1 Tax=Rickettsiella grylli TaxID=59196 RepID=UPI0009F81113|nr:FeoA family protein [Rickettsiella grylli]